jgi:hypothetical protein
VRLDRPRTQEKVFGDAHVGPAFGHLTKYRALAFVERVNLARLAIALEQPPDDGRVYDRFSGGHPGQAVH